MLRFLREYIKTPNTIGAIAPSSRRLAAAMTDAIDFGRARCIVEYGAGTGVFIERFWEVWLCGVFTFFFVYFSPYAFRCRKPRWCCGGQDG